MSGKSNLSKSFPSIPTQMRPLVLLTMNAISLSVTFSAAMIRSPSFSRSSSSSTTTNLPFAISFSASWTGAKPGLGLIKARRWVSNTLSPALNVLWVYLTSSVHFRRCPRGHCCRTNPGTLVHWAAEDPLHSQNRCDWGNAASHCIPRAVHFPRLTTVSPKQSWPFFSRSTLSWSTSSSWPLLCPPA